jgi:hypothetical protein
LLVAIKYTPGVGIRELAGRERISAPALTKHIDRLERNGLVVRTPSPNDGRRVGLASPRRDSASCAGSATADGVAREPPARAGRR